MRFPIEPVSCLAGVLAIVASGPLAAQGFGAAVDVGPDGVLIAQTGSQSSSGSVYRYVRSGDGWTVADVLRSPEAEAGDGFGRLLARDGDRLLVASGSAAYVFEGSGDAWNEAGKLELESPLGFGSGVLLVGDLVLISPGVAGFRGGNQPSPPGEVLVSRRDASGTWSALTPLVPEQSAENDRFGAAMTALGDRVFIGAPGFAAGNVEAAGALYVFGVGDDGALSQMGDPIVAGQARPNTGLGTNLLAHEAEDGVHLFATAGGAAGTGAVYHFVANEEGEFSQQGRFFPPVAANRAQFGRSLTMVDGELWVGATVDADREGAVYRYAIVDGDWQLTDQLTAEGRTRGSQFGTRVAAGDDVVAVVASGKDYGWGTAYLFGRDGNGWTQEAEVWNDGDGYTAVAGSEVACTDGMASDFECADVDIQSFITVGELGAGRGVRTNDVWGWTDPQTGREYALVGMTDQASFVDVTDANNPRLIGRLPMTEGANGSTWRDIKVYGDYAYIVADGAGQHGMQIFDLTRFRDVGEEPVTFEADAHYDGVASAHNVVIHENSPYAYIVGARGGGETCGGGLHMVDISDASNPTFAGCFAATGTGRRGTGYSHDAMCIEYQGPDAEYQGREICFGANETDLSIADVTDKYNPVAISTASYPNVGYAHQGWITEDHRYFYLDDELDEIADARDGESDMPGTRTLIWDISDLDDPVLVKEHFGETLTSDHNLYIVGDYAYQSNYVSGLRILDVSDPENPSEVAFFDTVPHAEAPGFAGSWSNYPFFESGTILVTSGTEGLFMLKHRQRELVP